MQRATGLRVGATLCAALGAVSPALRSRAFYCCPIFTECFAFDF